MIYLIIGIVLVVAGALMALNVGRSGDKMEAFGNSLPGPGKTSPGWWWGVCIAGIGVILVIGGVANL